MYILETTNVYWICECGTRNEDKDGYCCLCGVVRLETLDEEEE